MSGILAGERGEFDCPVSIQLFGTSQAAEQADLRARMKSDRLPTDAIDKREKEAKKKRAADLKKVVKGKKGSGSTAKSNQQWEHGSSQPGFAGNEFYAKEIYRLSLMLYRFVTSRRRFRSKP